MTNAPDNRQAKLNELYELGKRKGTLTYKEIMNALMELDMDPDQLDKVLETLEALGVEVVNELELSPEGQTRQGREPEPIAKLRHGDSSFFIKVLSFATGQWPQQRRR